MDTIKEIKLGQNVFHVLGENSSLKLDYREEFDKYVIDISSMNLINATKIAILASTYCFLNGFSKKLCWLVKDDEIKRAISILRLRNTMPQVKEQEELMLGLAS